MGTMDEIRSAYGDDFFERRAQASGTPSSWSTVCLCGHLQKHHSATVGGTYVLPTQPTQTIRGKVFTKTFHFDGCMGARRLKGQDPQSVSFDEDELTIVTTVTPTCSCAEFRPVARVDRPNRMFCQLAPRDFDSARHPFMVGLRAMSTHLGKRKHIHGDADLLAEEFDRRFQWLDGARICALSKCRETDDVWPVFISKTDDRSELRCAKHR